ncbi:MAG: hypothetical protein ABS69_12025 [Nitrosomonadales bacterium SCN 54-20]|nr:MAG: hypothetical protein ABS69_12025 [Nitrosomonadales bacterium SCN 54-20]
MLDLSALKAFFLLQEGPRRHSFDRHGDAPQALQAQGAWKRKAGDRGGAPGEYSRKAETRRRIPESPWRREAGAIQARAANGNTVPRWSAHYNSSIRTYKE